VTFQKSRKKIVITIPTGIKYSYRNKIYSYNSLLSINYLDALKIMEIGLKIKKLRAECGIKQEDLSMFLGVSQAKLSKIENGNTFVSFEQVINIAAYLKVPLAKFLPNDLEKLERVDFIVKLEELHQEIKMHKETIINLNKVIENLEIETQLKQLAE